VTGKRALDVVAAGAVLLVAAPVFALVALAQVASGVPVLWRSPRVGMNGQTFALLSFRTMREPGRRTRVGRVLRNVSLDHLPNLINVVRGDMSLVGPRPTEPERVDLRDPAWRHVLTVRPGVVSYAILSLARTYNSSSPQQRLRLEVAYVDQASLGFDVRLVLRAVGALLRSRGNVKTRGSPAP
jgi:lipopolysaccharide/colanic/teichoic acid biosynthesis glycosyltransferase